MSVGRTFGRVMCDQIAAVALLACFAGVGWPAHASPSTLKSYGTEQGLASLGGACMSKEHASFLLVCTEHGVFAYDGRRFANLGTAQGLRSGGEVFDIAESVTGQVAIRYAEELFVSEARPDPQGSPTKLSFQRVINPIPSYDEKPHRIVPWQNGFVFLAGDTVVKITTPAHGPAVTESMGYDPSEQKTLRGGAALFLVAGHLWETFDHGRICSADPGAVKCFQPGGALTDTTWFDVVDRPGGGLLARSRSSVGSLDPQTGRWVLTVLPDQDDRYDNYQTSLGLYRTPDGSLFTQANHGLAMLTEHGWRVLTVEDGAPPGMVVGSTVDGTGQFWFQIRGSGLMRWVGYGHWESVRKSNGLSEGVPWQTARSADGSIWVSTDTAVDQLVRSGFSLRVSHVVQGSSFTIAIGPDGKLWRSAREGVRIRDPISGSESVIDTPLVNAIVSGSSNDVWLATQGGLFNVDLSAGSPGRPTLKGSPRAQIESVVLDDQSGVFYLSSGRLRHYRSNGTDIPVAGEWPTDGFTPRSIAKGQDGSIWAGGSGGLYRFILSGDTVTRYTPISTADTRTNTIDAIMVDHRGWVWVGTALGVSVYDGRRWVSVDSDSGLVSDDVDEGGLREDPDGSVWITTTQGLSHLLDPMSLFADRPIRAVISSAELGSRPVDGAAMPFTQDALTLQFGTPNYGSERSVLFRYHLSGVDSGVVESSSGLARYPFVPPGHHLLTVTAYDELSHRSSSPIALVVDVGYPWWQQWWAELLWAAGAALLLCAVMRVRFRAIEASREELKRRVAEATERLRYDRLTGLYIRSEIEERLAAKLSVASLCKELVVALIDIDHFKLVNDTYGHLGGDDVLRAMGRLVLKDVWDGEYAGRYGGEEILLVLDDCDGRGAERVLHLLHAIRGTPFNAAGHSIRVTCSIGVAWAMPGDDWESLIGRADDALYEAKSSGRDQVAERRSGSLIARDARNERRSMRSRAAE